ncbi:MAG: MIP/aquaporin family protein [Bacteroidales bacterium]
MNEFTAELLGTMLMILMGAGVVANVVLKGTKGNNSGWIVITTAWALGVYIGVVVAGPVSGAHLNPVVTLALTITGKFPVAKVGMYVLAQFLGAAIGALLVWISYKDHFNSTYDQASKLGVFCTSPAIRNYPINFICELIGTFALIFVILYITGPEINDASHTPIGMGSLGAIPVSLLVWVIGLSLGGTTGYAINPARDLAPRIMHAILPISNKGGNDWQYAWVPILGPIAGSTLAALVFLILK